MGPFGGGFFSPSLIELVLVNESVSPPQHPVEGAVCAAPCWAELTRSQGAHVLFVYRPDRVIDGTVERSAKVPRTADTHTHKSL